jgi:general secretion pathway protein M
MEPIKKLFNDAAEYLAAASPREKRLVGLASGAVVFVIVLVVATGFSSSIYKKSDSLDEKRADFEKVQRLAADFGERERERQLLEAKLRQSPPALMSFVDGMAKSKGVDIGSMSDRGVVQGGQNGKPRESSVEVNLGKVPLEKLTDLLQSIERSPGVVRVRRLRVRKSTDNKDTLDVTMTISTWAV